MNDRIDTNAAATGTTGHTASPVGEGTDVWTGMLKPASSKSNYRSLELFVAVNDHESDYETHDFHAVRDYIGFNAPDLYLTADEADKAAELLRTAASKLREASSE